jgi:glucose/arabinose dehydrogenase
MWSRGAVTRRMHWVAAVVVAGLVGAACGNDASGGGLTSIGAGVRGPSGIQATVYAQGLTHASGFAYDDQGRLWVATAAAQDDGTDGVYVVAAPGAAPVRVISDVHTPLGLLWLGGSLYVASAGRVDVESGFAGTRFTSSRTIVTLPAGTGEVNGLALLADGRIAMGISAPCDHCAPTLPYSASVVTFQPDGSDLQVEASGIRAPVGLTVFPSSGALVVSMDQRDDLGAATPGDWLGVVQSGQDWGFPSCYGQEDAACASAPSPLAVLDRHAAVSGVAVVTGQLGSTVGTAALVAEWTKGEVVRVALSSDGTRALAVEPFLTGLQNPEPVLTTPSGTVLVGDWQTGTVYAISA